MKTTPDQQHDVTSIHALMDDWCAALKARDMDRLMQMYAADVLFFDVTPPYQTRGKEAYRKNWEELFPHLPESIDFELAELKVTVGGDVAFAHGLNRMIKPETGENATCGWVRVTVCFQRLEGDWKVVHEHVSLPFDSMSSQVVFIERA